MTEPCAYLGAKLYNLEKKVDQLNPAVSSEGLRS